MAVTPHRGDQGRRQPTLVAGRGLGGLVLPRPWAGGYGLPSRPLASRLPRVSVEIPRKTAPQPTWVQGRDRTRRAALTRASTRAGSVLRHQPPRCTVGSARPKLYDALSDKAPRCVVGPQLPYTRLHAEVATRHFGKVSLIHTLDSPVRSPVENRRNRWVFAGQPDSLSERVYQRGLLPAKPAGSSK
jgi:hypothetical protein